MITREVSAGDVKGAEFQNFSNLGDASRRVISQAGMKGLHPDSPAYGRLMSTLMSNEASQRAAGRDPYRNANDSMAAVQAAAPAVLQSPAVRGAYRALGMDVPEPQRPVRQAGGAPAPGPVWNAGSVNGEAVMAPTPGNYSNMLEQRRRVGLNDPGQSGLAEYNQAQNTMAGEGYTNPEMDYRQQADAADVNARRAAAAADHKRQVELNDQQREHARQLELERTKNQPEMLKAGQPDTKSLQAWHGDQVSRWSADQVKAQKMLGMIQGMPDVDAQGNPNRVVVDDQGTRVPVATIRAQAQALNYEQPTYERSLQMLGTPEAMQELTRRGKDMGAAPVESEGAGGWLGEAVQAGAGMVKRTAQKTAQEYSTRRQVLSTLKPNERKALENATPEQQAAFWREMGV